MSQNRTASEREFEELLVEVLTQDYGLEVRTLGDNVGNRRKKVPTLCFDYHNTGNGSEAKIEVSIEGIDEFSHSFCVDLGDEKQVRECAEDSEALALFLSEHLEGGGEDFFAALDGCGYDGFDRCEDDYL